MYFEVKGRCLKISKKNILDRQKCLGVRNFLKVPNHDSTLLRKRMRGAVSPALSSVSALSRGAPSSTATFTFTHTVRSAGSFSWLFSFLTCLFTHVFFLDPKYCRLDFEQLHHTHFKMFKLKNQSSRQVKHFVKNWLYM